MTAAYLVGKEMSMNLFESSIPFLLEDLPLLATAPGGQIEFRKTLAMSFLKKFFIRTLHQLDASKSTVHLISALHDIERLSSSGTQVNKLDE